MTGLTAGTTYYVRAYSTNSAGISYGDQITFTTPNPNEYGFYVGQNHEGGTIFYIDGTGKHGLIAAPEDFAATSVWGCYGTLVGATHPDIGTGNSNTELIINKCLSSESAAFKCGNLVDAGGYGDWYLPSKDELNLMYQNKNVLGVYYEFGYWSSTEKDSNYAWGHVFGNGAVAAYPKVENFKVRAIRSF